VTLPRQKTRERKTFPTHHPKTRALDADEAAVAKEPEPEPEAEPRSVPAPIPVPAPELAEAEGVLLSLRHAHRDLLLGVREARSLADAAAEWLRRGVSAPDLRRALTTGLPTDGIRSAVGFLRHRLIQKLPAARRIRWLPRHRPSGQRPRPGGAW
jgi:hypothetical protein